MRLLFGKNEVGREMDVYCGGWLGWRCFALGIYEASGARQRALKSVISEMSINKQARSYTKIHQSMGSRYSSQKFCELCARFRPIVSPHHNYHIIGDFHFAAVTSPGVAVSLALLKNPECTVISITSSNNRNPILKGSIVVRLLVDRR